MSPEGSKEEIEGLEELSNALQGDERWLLWRIQDSDTGKSRALQLEDFHRAANSVVLDDHVPEKVRNHFATAQNLVLYSWFYYPFNVAAQLHGFLTVELALRVALKARREDSLRRMLRRAVAEEMIRDEGFSHLERLRSSVERLPEDLGIGVLDSYAEALADSLPSLRNALAHGSTMLHHGGAESLRICSELINQLFERRKSGPSRQL